MLMAEKKALNLNSIVSSLLIIWCIYLLVYGIFQLCGLQQGYKVWPLGEDRNWLGFMLNAKGISMAHMFWTIDNRNPLQPWWWYLISPLLNFSDYSLYLVRKSLDPLLAIATFLLVDRIHYHRSRLFAFSVGLIVLLWNFNAYIEQIIWNALLALFFTVITIFFYCRYVDEQKKNGFDLAIALVCYFLALATYTLQSGAIIAIAAIAFFRPENRSLLSRFLNAISDTMCFFIIFTIFSLIWYTTSTLGETYYSFNFSKFVIPFLKSIKTFLYHENYGTFWYYVKSDWSMPTICLIVGAAFLAIFFILQRFTKKHPGQFEIHFGWLFVILVSIAAPTIVLESTNTIWLPGTRAFMLQQVWQPLLYISVIFLVISKVPFLSFKVKQSLLIILVSALGSITFLFGMNYNHRLVVRTELHTILAKGLQDLHIPGDISPHFLIKIVDSPEYQKDLFAVSPFIYNYGPTLLHRKNAIVRFFTTQNEFYMPLYAFWRIGFGNDKEGVFNASPINNTAPLPTKPETLPYKHVWIVFFDGKKVSIPNIVNESDLKDYPIIWHRKTPIDQFKMHQEV